MKTWFLISNTVIIVLGVVAFMNEYSNAGKTDIGAALIVILAFVNTFAAMMIRKPQR